MHNNYTDMIIVLCRLPSEVVFDLLLTTELPVAWGMATVFVYRRNAKAVPGIAADPRLRLQELLSRDSAGSSAIK